jgi:hypothetical protein
MQNLPQDSTHRTLSAKERVKASAESVPVSIPKGIASSAKIPISFMPIGFIPPLPPLPPVSKKVCVTDFRESLILDLEETLSVENDIYSRNNKEIDRSHQALPNLIGYKKEKSPKNNFKPSAVAGILFAVFLGSGLLGGYFLCQFKFSASTANSIARNDFKPTYAIASQSMLTSTRSLIADIETSEQKMDKLLAVAQAKYKSTGNLKEVRPMLQNIPSNSRIRPKADKLLLQWQLDAKKNESTVKKAEKALNEGKWQLAIDSVKGISSTPYWQKRGIKIAAEAKQRLAKAPAAPVPISAPPIQSSYPLSDRGYAPVEPEYVPDRAPIYEPPSTSDREPARSYTAPVVPATAPPPPRVAQ